MSTETNPNPAPAASGTDPKTIGIVSYLTWIGWIIAYVLYGSSKSQFAAFHIRQSLFLHLSVIMIWILQWFLVFIPFIGWAILWISWLLFVGLLVLWVVGLVAAINGQEKPIPLFGATAQKWFAGIK